MRDFDAILRKGFEKLIGKNLEDRWWRAAQLPAKFGGMAMRSGFFHYSCNTYIYIQLAQFCSSAPL